MSSEWNSGNFICEQCGGLTSKWMAKDGVCQMCSTSNKIKKESEPQCSHIKSNDGQPCCSRLKQTLGDGYYYVCMRCNKLLSEDEMTDLMTSKPTEEIKFLTEWGLGSMSKESVWNETDGVGTGFYRRVVGGKWTFRSWKDMPSKYELPTTRDLVEKEIKKWNTQFAGQYEYSTVQCSQCHGFHVEWVGHLCQSCEETMGKSKLNQSYNVQGWGTITKPQAKTLYDLPVKSGGQMATFDVNGGTPYLVESQMKNGDVRKLPKANSPMWTDQWAAQGSAKKPYVVSHKTQGANGATTEDGWACSCRDFTQHTPRTDCKHIIRVQKKEGLLKVTGKLEGANIPASQQAAFEKFLRQEKQKKIVAATPAGDVVMVGDSTGRKFR